MLEYWRHISGGSRSSARLRQLIFLAGVVCAVTYERMALGPLQEAMRFDLGLSDNQVAWLQGPTLAVPMAIGAIPFGVLVDRYPRSRLLLFFACLGVCATLIGALSRNWMLMFASRSLVGFAVAGTTVAVYSLVADLYGPEQRGRATMLAAIGEVCGGPIAFALGGFLLVHGTGVAGPDSTSWRGALTWMGVAVAPVLLFAVCIREPVRTGVVIEKPRLPDVWRELWAYKGLMGPLLLARMMMWIADGAVLVWAAPSFARRFNLPPDRVGALIGAALLAGGLLGPLLGGPLADLCQRTGGPRRTMTALVGLALLSVPSAFFSQVPDSTLAAAILAIFLILGYALGTAAITVGTIVIPGELRGVYLATTVTLAAVFFVGVAPLVVSHLAEVLGGPLKIGLALGIACAMFSALGCAVLAASRRKFPVRTA